MLKVGERGWDGTCEPIEGEVNYAKERCGGGIEGEDRSRKEIVLQKELSELGAIGEVRGEGAR